MILFERCRMSERELITALFDLCSSYIPLSAMLKKMIASAYDLLFKPKISATFYKGENNSSSSSNDGVHLKPTIVSLPVIVSVDAITRSEGDLADGRLDNRLKVSSVVAIQLVEKGRNMRATTFIDQFKHICYCYLLRNEINKSGILDLLISVVLGQKRSRSLLESVKTRNVPACPMSAVSIQACVHMIEALTVIIGLEVQDVKYNTASSHVATAVTSLLGLQLAIKNHRDAYRRYISKNCDQHSISNNGNGGKEYFSQNDGGVFATQTPWVTADIQAISMSLDDGFARILSKYGDIIPSYSYPTSYLSELKIRLAEIEQ